ncbi:MAG: hypothetical protein AAF747_02945 [Planctomycetota bacterium]
MEVHRQRCQKCDSLDVHCLIAREPGKPTSVYVRCVECGSLVARYVLSDYYHHGKGAESFLRTHDTMPRDSGREVMQEFERAEREAVEGYEAVLEQLKAEDKEP